MNMAFVTDIARQMGMKLSKVHLIDGKTVGCNDSHTLLLASKGCNVSRIIYQKDLMDLEKNGVCNRLEAQIREALSRLQILSDL